MPNNIRKTRWHRPWAYLSIRHKLGLMVMLMLLAMVAMVASMITETRLTMEESYSQVKGYYNINSLQNTLLDADSQLESYLRSPAEGEVFRMAWEQDMAQLEQELGWLDRDLTRVSHEQYLLANALVQGAEPYREHCELFFAMSSDSVGVSVRYEAYERIQKISGYLKQYAHQLQSLALSNGQNTLAELQASNRSQNSTVMTLGILAGLVVLAILAELVRCIVTPVLRLSRESEEIRDGNFDTPDLTVDNQDEMFTLTLAFNQMKHSMKKLITTLQENNEMEQALHQKELEAEQSRRLMEEAKMQQLRSQINPHFLFNTLNTISRTARREHAPVSEKLILSLARLFRYSLRTDDDEVPLRREMRIVDDYVSIQATRFEGRVAMQWRIAPALDPDALLMPTFILQPLVENAIIHGLEPKVEGGLIRIRVHTRGSVLHLIISDNGVGMSAQTRAHLLSAVSVQGHVSGIGVGNVRSRLRMLYPGAGFRLYSRPGRGTCIHLTIPRYHSAQALPELPAGAERSRE